MERRASTTRLYLVRHGTVAPEWRGRFYGELDVPLSPEGLEQARVAAERLADLDLAAVATSDLERARLGAELVCEGRGLAPRVDPRLRELSRGRWAGLSFEELEQREPGALRAWLADPDARRPPGGESLADLRTRVTAALRALTAEHPGRDVAVVAHGWVLRSLLAAALGLPGATAARLRVPPASIAVVDWRAPRGEALDLVVVGVGLDAPPSASRAWYRAPGD